jgi:hypothetical protein
LAPPAPTALVAASEQIPAAAPVLPARIELHSDQYTVLPGQTAARIEVRRRGSLDADVSFVWWTEAASAKADRDFISWGRRSEQIPAGRDSATLLVPIVSDATRHDSRVFYVIIGEPGGSAELGGNYRASVLLAGGD